jgi:hypothetical protein
MRKLTVGGKPVIMGGKQKTIHLQRRAKAGRKTS